MTISRRTFLHSSAAASTLAALPFSLSADGHLGDLFDMPGGVLEVSPIQHASVMIRTPVGLIAVDPVWDAGLYERFEAPDLVLLTHEHGDHFDLDILQALVGDNTTFVTNPGVHERLPADWQAKNTVLANGDSTDWRGMGIDAIPAHNLTEERLNFHPKGPYNGYVMNMPGYRVYLSGDTEDIPEMRGLENIDLAFVCMNLPFTMDMNAAASAIAEFKPKIVYPYHYRGRDGGTQDPREFAQLVSEDTSVLLGRWYGGEVLPG